MTQRSVVEVEKELAEVYRHLAAKELELSLSRQREANARSLSKALQQKLMALPTPLITKVWETFDPQTFNRQSTVVAFAHALDRARLAAPLKGWPGHIVETSIDLGDRVYQGYFIPHKEL